MVHAKKNYCFPIQLCSSGKLLPQHQHQHHPLGRQDHHLLGHPHLDHLLLAHHLLLDHHLLGHLLQDHHHLLLVEETHHLP